jgi:hypothetical protein
MINKNSDENKVRTEQRFSAGLALCLVTLAVLMTTGSSTATIVYADSSNSNSSSGSTGSTSSGNNPVSSSSQGGTVHCDRPGYPSYSALGSEAGKSAPGTSCPPGQ